MSECSGENASKNESGGELPGKKVWSNEEDDQLLQIIEKIGTTGKW